MSSKKHFDEKAGDSPYSGEVTAMLLSSITYCSWSNNVNVTFNRYFKNWSIEWESKDPHSDHYAFIAHDNAGLYVLAIRGSAFNFTHATFENWLKEDFNIYDQVPWVYVDKKQSQNDETIFPMISKGAETGLKAILKLQDKTTGDTIHKYMNKNIGPGKSLWVTGHSLGASLATVTSLWLRQNTYLEKRPHFEVITFAGPTIGNESFAALFDRSFPDNSWRYINVLDIAPMVANKIADMATLYNSHFAPEASHVHIITHTLADEFRAISDKVKRREDGYRSHYTCVNSNRGTVELNKKGTTYPNKSTHELSLWFEQAGEQHSHENYLEFLPTWKKGDPSFKCGASGLNL